ncbi:hypothetical protein GN956_G14852 [Arapaima gigas]
MPFASPHHKSGPSDHGKRAVGCKRGFYGHVLHDHGTQSPRSSLLWNDFLLQSPAFHAVKSSPFHTGRQVVRQGQAVGAAPDRRTRMYKLVKTGLRR